ncbi:MAG TPA: BA14K family protein [Pseudolabrys sp.]|nr:BA14K family protein [Pseudolabrys sp.]
MPFLVYAIALVIAAGTLAFSVNLATAPDPGASKPRIAANAPVRQIPLGKPSDVAPGDPHDKLTPVYPAAPGKNLPPPEEVARDNAQPNDASKAAAVTEPAPPANASTTGVASADTKIDQPRVDVSTAAPNSCAVDACSSAYRSFRASDCTYQPYGGPRKVCELTSGGMQNASAVPASPPRAVEPSGRISNRAGDIDAAARVVRQLPYPDEYEDARDRRVIVIERPRARYAPRVIYEEW